VSRSLGRRAWRSIPGLLPLAVAFALVGCKSSTSGLPEEDDASSADQGEDGSASQSSSGSSSGGSSGGSSSGSNPSSSGSSGGSSGTHGSSSGSGSGGCVSPASTPRVPSAVIYDAGLPLCGSTPCDLSSHVCCVNYLGDGTCLASGSTCPTSGNLPQAQFECLQASDCTCGKVCCVIAQDTAGASSAGSSCQDISATGACSPVADAGSASKAGSAQLCQTNAECKNDLTCSWQACDVQTPYGPAKPNLTMCGGQTEAPFNCAPCPGSSNCASQ
jgi:hypothetical protein